MLSDEWKNKDIGQEKTLESLNLNIAKIRLGNYLVILAKIGGPCVFNFCTRSSFIH